MGNPSAAPGNETQALLNALEEGILIADGGRVRAANGALLRLVGEKLEDLVGRRLAELFADPEGAPLATLTSSDGVRLRDANGTLLPVSLRVVNARTCIVIDRSRERRLEQEVWRLAGPDAGRICLGDAPLASEVAGMIEHEIGTAATVVRGYLRMLLEERAGPLTSEQKSFLLEARRETDRTCTLVANLLELAATGNQGALRVVRKPERLTPLIEQAVEGCRSLFAEHELVVELDLELSEDLLRIDASRIEQVMVNLLSNAAKFAPFGTTIRVAAHELEQEEGPRIAVSVIDQGPGVARDEADQIFKPFSRGTHARTEHIAGVGLGLAVCHAIAVAHEGRVEAVPDLGHGHFRLILPARTEEEDS